MIGSGDVLEDDLSSAGDIGDPKALLDQSGTLAIQRLKFDSCQISLASYRLLKYVHEIMISSCKSSCSSSIANLLFHSARDCLEIFIAIIPIKFEEIINTIPRMGAVFYNDCLYIAHNAILLTHKYRTEMNERIAKKKKKNSHEGEMEGEEGKNEEDEEGLTNLQGNIGFIDFIPRLRKLGDQVMRNHLSQQESLFKEMIKRIRISPNKNKSDEDSSSPASLLKKSIGTGGMIADRIADRLKNKFLNKSSSSSLSDKFENEINEEDACNDENRASILVDQLEKLSTQWLGVLQESVYCRFMGFLIDNILKEAMNPVLVTECITETAASEIYRIYKIFQRVR
jgi:hypothetical protein